MLNPSCMTVSCLYLLLIQRTVTGPCLNLRPDEIHQEAPGLYHRFEVDVNVRLAPDLRNPGFDFDLPARAAGPDWYRLLRQFHDRSLLRGFIRLVAFVIIGLRFGRRTRFVSLQGTPRPKQWRQDVFALAHPL